MKTLKNVSLFLVFVTLISCNELLDKLRTIQVPFQKELAIPVMPKGVFLTELSDLALKGGLEKTTGDFVKNGVEDMKLVSFELELKSAKEITEADLKKIGKDPKKITKEDIKNIEGTDVTNFDFLKNINISANNGDEIINLGYLTEVEKGQTTLKLIVPESALDDYIKSDKLALKMGYESTKMIKDFKYNLKMTFELKLKVLDE